MKTHRLFSIVRLTGRRVKGNARPPRQFRRHFLRDETGAAYSLSILLILPFYMIFLAVVLELVFLLLARMGTIHASYAAARSACVHVTVAHPDTRRSLLSSSDLQGGLITHVARRKATQAAVNAMVPFASGLDTTSSASSADSSHYVNAYKKHLETTGEKERIGTASVHRRYASVRNRIRVTIRREATVQTNEPWKETLVARIEYDAPFRLPYIGRLLGGVKKNGAVVKTCFAETVLPLEIPQNQSGYLGVPVPGTLENTVSL